MMKILKKILLAGLITLGASSCKDQLENFSLAANQGKTVSVKEIDYSKIEKESEFVRIPMTITLSGAATKTFQVQLESTGDTINKLITNNTLSNTVALASTTIEYPSTIEVVYGAGTANVKLGIKISAIERNFGKKVAVAFKLTSAGKGNEINPLKSTVVVVLNTTDVLNFADIHYLSIAKYGGKVSRIEQGGDYTVTSDGIKVSMAVDLAGVPASFFTVGLLNNIDTVQKLITSKAAGFENAKALKTTEVRLEPAALSFKTNQASAIFSVTVPWTVFDANTGNNTLALALKLVGPSMHALHPTNYNAILLFSPTINLDNNAFVKGIGTGLKGEYFRGNKDLPMDPASVATRTRIDQTINFAFGANPFSANVPLVPWDNDNWSARWKGKFLAPHGGDYIFYQDRWNDGAMLIINGVMQYPVTEFNDTPNRTQRITKIRLERGKMYDFEIWYRQNTGTAEAYFEYEVTGLLPKQIVPRTQFYPAP
jgi:hypothetical protein